MKNKIKAILIFLLPILILSAWALRLHLQGASGVEVEWPVEGFDPRDPISGHYVTYRLAMGHLDPCRPNQDGLIDREERRCLCFDNGARPQANWAGACAEKPGTCRHMLQGHCPWSGFTAGVERFFIPESDSVFLQQVPPRSRVILSLSPSGAGQVKAFLPEGEDYGVWIRRKRQEKNSAP